MATLPGRRLLIRASIEHVDAAAQAREPERLRKWSVRCDEPMHVSTATVTALEEIFRTAPARVGRASELSSAYDDLVRSAPCSPLGVLPHPTQNVARVHELVLRLAESHAQVVVFAFDGVGFEYFARTIASHFARASPSWVVALTSLFPSTTATVWPSVVTGALPSEHGLYGTSFRHEFYDESYVWLNHTVSTARGERRHAIAGLPLSLAHRPTVFEQLRDRGVRSAYVGQHGKGSFMDELTRGAHVNLLDHGAYQQLERRPGDMLARALAVTRLELAQGDRSLIWNYLNFDDFLHAYGTDCLTSAVDWGTFARFWESTPRAGRCFLLLSDHGQVAQDTHGIDVLMASRQNPDLAIATSGAGRTLYLYPRPGRHNAVRQWIADLVGDQGVILHRSDLVASGLLAVDAVAPERIGEIVAIATGPGFPSVGASYRYEHGALTPTEMVVPLVVSG